MTIILNAAGEGAVTVENYNDGEQLAATRDLAEAVEIAASSAVAGEAIVRVRLGNRLGSIDITTSPRYLFLKIYLLRAIMFLLGRLVGMPDLARLLDRAAETGTFHPALAPARPPIPGRMVCTPLRLDEAKARGDYVDLLNYIRAEMETRGYHHMIDHLVSRDGAHDGLLDSIVFSDNRVVCFYGYGEEPDEPALRLLREAETDESWVTAVRLAISLGYVAADENANALLFWTPRA